mgnify:CR=1 FL=1
MQRLHYREKIYNYFFDKFRERGYDFQVLSNRFQNVNVTQIAEKQETVASLNTEIASITANIDTLKADLKEKKTALKSAEKEVAKLEAKKAKADQKAAEEAKKSEAEAVVKRLLAGGMSADEILEKLK